MKKLLVGVLAVVMAVTGAVMLVACGDAQSAVRKDGTVYNSAPTAITTDAYNNAEQGINFKDDRYDTYETSKALGANLPRTMQATFTIAKDYAARAGIIVGNHRNTVDNAWNFEIQWNGTSKFHYPKLYYMSSGAKGSDNQIFFNFQNVKLTAGTEYFVTIVHDTYNGKATCYAYDPTGALQEQTVTTSDADYNVLYVDGDGEFIVNLERPTRIGGDYRNPGNTKTENNCNFKGTIKNVSLFSDIRTKKEVASDWSRNGRVYVYDENMIAAYDFTQTGDKICNDLSGNGYNLVATKNDFAKNMDGMAFGRSDSYIVDDKFDEIPNTYETYLYLPENYTSRGGVILGNYKNASSNCFSFEIHNNGMPKLYYDYANYNVTNVNFTGVSVALGRWVHVAIVHDTDAKTATLYLDGEVEMVLENVTPPAGDASADPAYSAFEFETDLAPRLGGDYRDPNKAIENLQYFKGLIHSVAVYSDVRTQDEIKADMAEVDTDDDALIAYYELAGQDVRETIMDLSGNGYNIGDWLDAEEVAETGDYDYSFAVIGDTQIVSERYSDKMDDIYKWVVDNASKEKIAHVFGLGDITNSSTDEEWTNAKKAISQMDGKVAYSLVRGNHDGSEKINSTFGYEAYTSQFAGFYEEGKIENSYKTFTAGGVDYLLITLDYGASDEVLAWAGNLCETYPNHKVIVTTHAYMFRDGTTLDQGDVCPPATTGGSNNGDHMWDKFVSKYGNIFLVMSGHDPCEKLVTTQTKGIHGNTVTQMLIDPQYTDRNLGGNGMVALLHVNMELGTIEVEYYSTVREQYFKPGNQKIITTLVHEFDKEVATEEFLATPATCTKPATYYYSCEHGLKSATLTFSYGEPIAHTFDKEIVSDSYLATVATCSKKATYFYSCECGAKGEETFEHGEFNANSHEYDQKVTTDKYFRAPATCSVAETYYYSCVCGLRGTVYFENGEPSNVHNFNKEVVSDEYKASDATCSKKATYFYSCECGEAGEETFTAGNFTAHEYDKQVKEAQFLFKQASCESPAVYFYSCECGAKSTEKFNDGEAAGHKFDDQYTCHDRVCSECNKTVSATTSHEYGEGEVVKQPTTSSEGEKKFTCGCGATKTESIAKLEGDDKGSSCSTVMPVGGNGTTPGGMALMIMSLFGMFALLLLKRRHDK